MIICWKKRGITFWSGQGKQRGLVNAENVVILLHVLYHGMNFTIIEQLRLYFNYGNPSTGPQQKMSNMLLPISNHLSTLPE